MISSLYEATTVLRSGGSCGRVCEPMLAPWRVLYVKIPKHLSYHTYTPYHTIQGLIWTDLLLLYEIRLSPFHHSFKSIRDISPHLFSGRHFPIIGYIFGQFYENCMEENLGAHFNITHNTRHSHSYSRSCAEYLYKCKPINSKFIPIASPGSETILRLTLNLNRQNQII